MAEIALRNPTAGVWRRIAETSRKTLVAIVEGFAAARRYERLAAMGDAELARRGLTREDIGWYALFGERRPR